ncbi:MAG: hypothetical protein ACOCP4_04480 [Candidatus Woesearchaeota archaeon]
MKVKDLIKRLEYFNPEKEVKYRNYDNPRNGYVDLRINDVRVGKDSIVIATQCGVE